MSSKHCKISVYICISIYVYFITSCHKCCTRRSELQLPEDGQNIWPKHVVALCGEYKHRANGW
jgi:hypothetical protein